MRTNLQEFLKNEKLPKFLVENKKLANITKVSKVFPSIGLPNCSEACKFDNLTVAKDTAANLAITMLHIMFEKFADKAYRDAYNAKIDRIIYWRTITAKMKDNHSYTSYVKINDGKVSIKLSYDVADNNNTVIFKKD